MALIIFVQLFIQKIILSPKLFYNLGKDLFNYIFYRLKYEFCGWGLHLYVGKFGSGKTSSMIYDAYLLCKQYPQLHILTNLKIQNFPAHTKILKLDCGQDILNAPHNTLVLIDEIGTIFNSRDFAKSKDSVPKILFQHLCQCRKRKLMIYSTTQRWNFLDKQLRDITATVRSCSMAFSYRFNRLATVRHYDSIEYDLAFSNPLLPLIPLYAKHYIQTDELRNLYDTSELIENMLAMEYISDEEILANQGYVSNAPVSDKDGAKLYKRRGVKR